MLYAFFDTTALHKSYTLPGTQWDSLEQASHLGVLRAATSDVTTAESARQAGEDARDINTKMSALVRDSVRFGVIHLVGPIPDDEGHWKATLEGALRDRLIAVVPHAKPSHEEILARDLSGRPPFKKSGEGYRDTLIWLTFLEWVRNERPVADDTVLFVSANTRQFSTDSTKELHPLLHAEVAALTEAAVRLTTNRSDVVDLAREFVRAKADRQSVHLGYASVDYPDPSELVEETAIAAADRLAGAAFDTRGRLTFEGVPVAVEVELPEVPEATIEWVEALPAWTHVAKVDTFDELTQLWSALVEAVLTVEGMIHKGDYPGLSDLVEVRDGDWNSHYMWVSFEVSTRLRYDVRLERGDDDPRAELVEATVFTESLRRD